jgi:hypothetical protein
VKKTILGFIMAAGAATLLGCGGSSATDDDAGVGDSTTTPTGPVVLEVSPVDGAAGVRTNAQIIIRFSRAMDTASVHEAFASPDLELADTGVTWNALGDTLTISLAGVVAYAEGGAPEEVTANGYSFSLATTATDEDGHPLEEGLAVAFTTARHIFAAPLLVEEETGTVGSEEGHVDDEVVDVGDSHTDLDNFHGLMTFDLSEVPDAILEVTQAAVSMRQAGVHGDPFGQLGTLYFEHVSFGELTQDAYDTSSLEVIHHLSDMIAYNVPVSAAVQDDLDNRVDRENRSQFRLRFSNINNGDDVSDYVAIIADSPALDLRFLIE